MAHNIDMSNDRANMAFLGSRKDIWHSLGQEMKEGMSIEEWQKAAGLDWVAQKSHAFAQVGEDDEMLAATDWRFMVRSDTKKVLGVVGKGYQPVQPRDVLDWFDRYIKCDPRFKLDVAGSLKGGQIIWATATFQEDISVNGDRHVARLLMTTTFDGSGSTINRATMTRVVCNNTLDCALADKAKSTIRTTHRSKFDPVAVGAELANIAKGFEAYKAMGEAMAKTPVKDKSLLAFFRNMLDIPEDAEKTDDVSTRKLNQLTQLGEAYKATLNEGTEPGTAWTALNAFTRWIDHDRSVRGNGGTTEQERRFTSAQFDTGSQLKAKAVEYLTDEKLLAAVSVATEAGSDDAAFAAMLSQPLRPSKFN